MSLNDNAGRAFAVEYKGRRFSGQVPERIARRANPLDDVVKVKPAAQPWLNDDEEYRYLETVEMSTREWAAIPSNPQQRSEAERVSKGRAGHLYKLDPSHRMVVACVLEDGSRYKIEGHTRTWIWGHGLSDAIPNTVNVQLWKARNAKAACDLYDKFDSVVTTETGPDRVTGATRDMRIAFDSPMLRSGEISTAVKGLWYYLTRTRAKRGMGGTVITEAVKEFAGELTALDGIGVSSRRFPTSVLMAAILTLRTQGEAARRFWSAYGNDLGNKVDGNRDAVAVFEERLLAALKKAPGAREKMVMREAAGAIKAYSKGGTYTQKRGYYTLSNEELREVSDLFFAGK